MDQGLYARPSRFTSARWRFGRRPSARTIPTSPPSLNNLAVLYPTQGFYGRAEPLYAARARDSGSGPRQAPSRRRQLAQQPRRPLQDQGLYARAEPLYERALAIREAALGKNHPYVATRSTTSPTSTRPRGCTRVPSRSMSARSPFWKRPSARTIPTSPHRSTSLALAPLAQHHLAEALPLSARLRCLRAAPAPGGARLLRVAPGQLPPVPARRGGTPLCAARAHPDDARVRTWPSPPRSFARAAPSRNRRHLPHHLPRPGRAGPRDLRAPGAAAHPARHAVAPGPGSLSPADYQQRLKELAEQGDALEADLARRSAPLRALTALPPPAEIVDRVAAALPRDGALVEFVAYVTARSCPSPALRAQSPGELRYLALVLFPDATTAPDLGPAAPIDPAASRLRDALASRDAAFQASAQALYQLAFRPLLPLLGKTHRLFLSPDGQLSLVPFAALHDGQPLPRGCLRLHLPHLGQGPAASPRGQRSPWLRGRPGRPGLRRSPRRTPRLHGAAAPRWPRAPRPSSASSPRCARTWPTSLGPAARHAPGGRGHPAPASPGPALPGPRRHQGAAAEAAHPGHPPHRHPWLLPGGRRPRPTASRAVGHFGALGEDPRPAALPDPLLRSGLVLAGARAPAAPAPAPAPARTRW